MICFVLVAFIVLKLEKNSQKSMGHAVYTHTHTHTHAHTLLTDQYFQIQNMFLFSLNFLYNFLITLLFTLPKIDSLHFPEFRNMCGTA